MMCFRFAAALAANLAFLSVGALAQTPEPARPAQIVGEVVAFDAASGRITLRGDNGVSTELVIRPNAPVLRVAPGSKDVKAAERVGLDAISVGDRVAASAHPVAGKIEAGTLLLMSKADLTQHQQREADEWRRATGGLVTAVDPSAKTFTIRSPQGPVTVRAQAGTDFRRYSKESVRYADASRSSLDEIRVGDQARVLGKRDAQGGAVEAERVVFGTFRQLAGTIRSVDPNAGEIQITDLATKSPVTVKTNADTRLRRLPEQMATMLARRFGGGPQGTPAGSASSADRQAPGGAQPGASAGGRPAADINQMLDRLPAVAVGDLKPGEAVILSSVGEDPARVTAVVALAGVEPLLRASPTATRDLMSGWLSGGGEGGDQGQPQ